MAGACCCNDTPDDDEEVYEGADLGIEDEDDVDMTDAAVVDDVGNG